MPAPQMFTNTEVLKETAKFVSWKINAARDLIDKLPRPFQKGEAPKFDTRHAADIASLVIDTSNVPEEKREAYYLQQVEMVGRAFLTLDEETRLPDPAAIKPYIKKMYDRMTVDTNIDWNNAAEVDRLLSSMKAAQSFATIAADFSNIVFELYPTLEDVRRLDNLTAKSSLICHDARIAMDSNPETSTTAASLGFGKQSYDSYESRVISELGHQVIDARSSGSDVVYIDALASEITKKHFLDEPFEVLSGGDEYNSDQYSKDYLAALAGVYKQTTIEQIPDKAIADYTAPLFFEYDRLYINGKSARDSILELQERGYTGFKAQAAVGKMLTGALTDGKSIVTLMQTVVGKGGKTEFRHQEIKVDLDRLNRVDKEETNYSLFRRFLDWARIWKIQRFKSNDARDAAQEKLRNSDTFQKALRAAEDTFISRYNSDEVQNKLGTGRVHEAIPKIVKAEEFEKNKPLENESERIPLTDIKLETNQTLDVEAKHDHVEKTFSGDTKTR